MDERTSPAITPAKGGTPSGQSDLKAICSQIIYDGFIRYNNRFHRITRRAQVRFENRDWKGHQEDIVKRIQLYERSAQQVVKQLRSTMHEQVSERELWHHIRRYFGERLLKLPDADFIRTFFNSVVRRIFGILGSDPKLEFLPTDITEDDQEAILSLNIHRYPYWHSFKLTFLTVLDDFSFRVPWTDLEQNAVYISDALKEHFQQEESMQIGCVRFEFIDSFFYQTARAYLVGRIIMREEMLPLVIAFKNSGSGIEVDTVLLSQQELSILFGYTRSYYFVNPNSVIGTVHFLHSLLKHKPIDELYTVLGRLRQGKTERYRIFTKHLHQTNDSFVHAEGTRGLVMIVFTLPSYNLVFKIIRDNPGYPKDLSHKEVHGKYQLVSQHDRAGRLIDTQAFLNLEFPLCRFAEDLLESLLQEAAINVQIDGEKLLFRHVYIERRVRPLNLFINEATEEDAQLSIIDYGQAIKDLANTNIFPGDLLLKNFGVTPHKRVVFYDYDEVSLVTDCNFREIPKQRAIEHELHTSTWYVNDNDIFPEEFLRFLSLRASLRETFLHYHSDLLSSSFWRNIRQRHIDGNPTPVIPYESPSLTPKPSDRQKSLSRAGTRLTGHADAPPCRE